MRTELLTSLRNPRIKCVVRLRDRRGRDREQKMIIEGYRGLLRALRSGYPVTELFVCAEMFQGDNETDLISALAVTGTIITRTNETVFRKLAYRDRPEGLLGVAPQIHHGLEDIRSDTTPPILLVAEAIEKPGNLGTMLRCADATGVTALILCDPCTDLFNPNVVRASTGNLFNVMVAEATSDMAISWLRANQIRTLAATPHASRLYTEVDMTGPLAIAVGTEQYGLSEKWLETADVKVRIPMLGMADSLNAATASAMLLYEAVRQRFAAGILRDKRPTANDRVDNTIRT